MLHPFFETLTENLTEETFLREFGRKYHYEETHFPAVAAVADAMKTAILQDSREGRAGWNWGRFTTRKGEYCPVCITLGPGIDRLQEMYLNRELLLEAYVVESLASELLLRAYPQWNKWVAEQGGCHVRRYHFLGSGADCPLEALPGLLDELEMPVRCTAAYCMLPKKSVAFYAELATGGDAFCEGICEGCGNAGCANRTEGEGRSV